MEKKSKAEKLKLRGINPNHIDLQLTIQGQVQVPMIA